MNAGWIEQRQAEAATKAASRAEARRKVALADPPDVDHAMEGATGNLRRFARGDTGIGFQIRQLVDLAPYANDGRVP